jgi:hypothetical protein
VPPVPRPTARRAAHLPAPVRRAAARLALRARSVPRRPPSSPSPRRPSARSGTAARGPPATLLYRAPARAGTPRAGSRSGLDSARLADAIAFAVASESKAPRDLAEAHVRTFGREPFGEAAGPFAERGAPTGVVLRGGYVVAEWGDPRRVDMTFSVTKSFLSTWWGSRTTGGSSAPSTTAWPTTWARGGARRRPGGRARPRGGDAPAAVRHAAQPHGDVGPPPPPDERLGGHALGQARVGRPPHGRPRHVAHAAARAPGSAYEYNDVRVNALALAATEVWRRPLPRCSPSS